MDWTFKQIEGPMAERKELTLSGWNAPFGRPRQDPVIREVYKSRVQTTRYPGTARVTRHAFGANIESAELKGRWMTRTGPDLANDIADRWVEFFQDERTCRIAWGNIVSWTGYIEELEIARESEHEIAWRMRIQLDARDDKVKRPAPKLIDTSIRENVKYAIGAWLSLQRVLPPPVENRMNPSFLDSLQNLAAELNKPAALMNKLANQIDDTAKKSFAVMQHFRGAVTGFRTAVLTFREAVVGAQIDTAMFVRSAESDIEWVKYQTSVDAGSFLTLDALSRLDRAAELQEKVEATKFIVAREGDTWESLSTRATGGPEKAKDIRTLNGARYGEKPVPGTSYLVQ